MRFRNCLFERRHLFGLNTRPATLKSLLTDGSFAGMAKYFTSSCAKIGFDEECTSQ